MENIILNYLKFIGIRPLEDQQLNKKSNVILKNLHVGEMYYFYDGCEIHKECIKVKNLFPETLYSPNKIAKEENSSTDIRVNICSIVGENGSGKSSLIDLVLRVINNLSAYILGEEYTSTKAEHLHFIENVFAELYVLIEEQIIHIKCAGELLHVDYFSIDYEKSSTEEAVFYPNNNNTNSLNIKIEKNTTCIGDSKKINLLRDFCYTIVTNYSLYAFNPEIYKEECNAAKKEIKIRETGKKNGFDVKLYSEIGRNHEQREIQLIESRCWLSGLFHKNDGYQTPIVIAPKRELGIIDTNSEMKLAEERLTNLLFEKDKTGKHFYKEINGKLIVSALKLSEEKNLGKRYLPKAIKKEVGLDMLPESLYLSLVDCIHEYITFEFKDLDKNKHYYKKVLDYIVYKTLKIFYTYNTFNSTYEYFVKLKDSISLKNKKQIHQELEDLWHVNSHITTKLWRAINYLRYEHIGNKRRLEIEEFSKKIDSLLTQNQNDYYPPRRMEELLPPPIFKVSFILYNKDDKKKSPIPFNTLSSGEKQITFTVSSFLYHLVNVESVDKYARFGGRPDDTIIRPDKIKHSRIAYKHVNAIFDEIELYFHPEMQRRFIYNLLAGLRQIPFEKIRSIQIMLVTHSPFILSDIPKQNILFLKKDGTSESREIMNTFGSNIHTMLRHCFFLKKGAMGEYAQSLIKHAIDKVNFHYLWRQKERENKTIETIKKENYQIIESLPNEYKHKLEDIKSEEIDYFMDWDFLEHLANIIEEPIIKGRLKEELRKAGRI